MKKDETVREMTLGQLKDIVTTMIGAIPKLSFAKAKGIIGNKRQLISGIQVVFNEFETNQFLWRIFEDPLMIPAVNGQRIIAEASDVFPGWIDSDLKKWGADEAGPETGETKTEVYEIVKDGNFRKLFGSLNSDISKLCLTQHQIIIFIEKHRSWLRDDGFDTFFLFRSKNTIFKDDSLGEYFVADVSVVSNGLKVNVDQFERSDVWHAEYRRRLVVPQLA
ncbi:MAG: hypothetical protein U9R06_03800 [Patescibacteria group bacterium]|nr:hypothetical protein [Patescibacteria group bacterium]